MTGRSSHTGRWWWLAGGALVVLAIAVTLPDPSTGRRTAPSLSATAPSGPAALAAADLHGTIVYSSAVRGDDDVFLVRLGAGEPVQLTDGPAKEFDPDLSPDGTRIAYRRNAGPDSDDADIWTMNLDGSDQRNLTNLPEAMNWAPSWTPDGRIVFSSGRGPGPALELWSMAADGSDVRRLAEGWCEYPQPSPDGSQFVCAASVGGPYDIVVVDATGGRRPLTTTPETEFGPTWSPDGAWIVFSRDTGERWELRRIRPDGTDESVVAAEGVFATWDPDGRVAWSGPGGITVAPVDGSTRVTIGIAADFLSWRP